MSEWIEKVVPSALCIPPGIDNTCILGCNVKEKARLKDRNLIDRVWWNVEVHPYPCIPTHIILTKILPFSCQPMFA